MKKFFHTLIYIFCLFLLIPATGIFAQVNSGELENLNPVEFINYEGPYSRIETRAQIRAIGYSLGIEIRAGQTRAGGNGRYFVIHSVSGADEDASKIDADIFGLGVDVGVDHIRNMRLILQGYLEGAYNYAEQDAALLAEYVTVYNAVYRSDMNYISSRYKNAALENITQDKAGLSIRYDEWPGRTLMIIPLGMVSAGPLSSIDTTPLTDPRVTEELREDPDMNIDARQEMVDLKERQSDEAAAQAEAQREAITQEEQRQAQERQTAELQQQEARQQQQEAQREQESIALEREQAGANQQELDQRQAEAEQREQEAAQQEREAEERQSELDSEEEALEEQRQEAERIQQYSEEKADEAQQDRREIAEDQQAIIDNNENDGGADRNNAGTQQQQAAPGAGIIGAVISGQDAPIGMIVKVDPATGREIQRSTLNTVNARTIIQVDGRILAIAGENRGNGAIRLIEISGDTLGMAKQGDVDIAQSSLLWVQGSDIYAISSLDGSLYISRFNSNLESQARSQVAVHPFASVTFAEGSIITQRSDGTALLLNPADLSEKR